MIKPAFLLFAMLVCLIPTASVSADSYENVSQALSQGEPTNMFENIPATIVLSPLFCAIGGIGLAGSLYYVAKGERASGFWLVTGYTASILNILVGIVVLNQEGSDKPFWIGFGTTNLVLGALDLGFTIWAHKQPEIDTQTKLTLGPAILADIEGNPVAGIGLKLVNW